MGIIKIKRQELTRARFTGLQESMGYSRAQTVGVLAMFWADTQDEGLEAAPAHILRQYLSVPSDQADTLLRVMADAGYLIAPKGDFRAETDDWAIVDNVGSQHRASERKRMALNTAAMRRGQKSGAAKKPRGKAAAKDAAPKAAALAAVDDAQLAKPEPAPEVLTAFKLACMATWDAYLCAFYRRYTQRPVRSARANSLIIQLVKLLGHDEAPPVLAFYVSHPSDIYVRALHPLEMAVRDYNALRTQWATGAVVTNQRAKAFAQEHDSQSRRQQLMREIEDLHAAKSQTEGLG